MRRRCVDGCWQKGCGEENGSGGRTGGGSAKNTLWSQMDGSFHDGLEERGPEGSSIDLADDATKTTLALRG